MPVMHSLGSTIRAVFAVSLALLPRLAWAQAAPPATAFPPPAAAPAAAPTSAPQVVAPPPATAPAAPSAPAAAPSAPAASPSAPAASPSAPATAPSAPVAAPVASPPAYPAPSPWAYPPPPPGYTYGYYHPPPLPPPPLRYPDDAAVRSSPFFDAIVLVADWQYRLSESVNLGAQAGVYVVRRLRLTAKLAFPTESSADVQSDVDGRRGISFLYAFSAGFAVVRTPTFVMAPGVMFARTDVSDYGTMLGLSLPFDWVLKSGMRLGLEGGIGSAFGGRSVVDCGSNCDLPRYENRHAGVAYWLQFQIGFGLNHPGPLPPPTAPPPTAAPPR